jgi:putative tricarboxylic transport membrane protein
MRRPYQITGALAVGFAAFVAYEAVQLRYYTPLGPGPGFFSFWLALIFGALGIGMILQASLRPAPPMPADFFADRRGYLRIGAVVLALGLTALLLERLGFRLTTFAVYLFLLFALGRQRVWLALAISLAGSVGVFYLFDRWLMVPLPVGVLGF